MRTYGRSRFANNKNVVKKSRGVHFRNHPWPFRTVLKKNHFILRAYSGVSGGYFAETSKFMRRTYNSTMYVSDERSAQHGVFRVCTVLAEIV